VICGEQMLVFIQCNSLFTTYVMLFYDHRYYEFEVITPGYMKVGWAKISCDPGKELGLDSTSYAFDGFVVRFSLVKY
jgi:hypothetical protein